MRLIEVGGRVLVYKKIFFILSLYCIVLYWTNGRKRTVANKDEAKLSETKMCWNSKCPSFRVSGAAR